MDIVVLPSRQHDILISIVREFIATAEPVGSATLTRKYDISASSATIRNDMAKLEELGYLFQPHTSAGRIPTDRAYRYYVNFLLEQRVGFSAPDEVQEALQEYERYEAHIQNLLEYTGKVLADLTHYTSLILAPRLRRTMFRYIKLTPIEDRQVLIILLTNTGAIINKVIRLEKELSGDTLDRMANTLNNRLAGMFFGDIHLDLLLELCGGMHGDILKSLTQLTKETLQSDENRFIYEGATNLMNLPEFQNLEKLRMVWELLEEEQTVADILKQTLSGEGVQVVIGQEHRLGPVQDCSFITATYQIDSIPLGSIGVMGPIRMPYHTLIPVVKAFARVFSNKLTKMSNS